MPPNPNEIHVFIDTNVLLDFYALSKATLDDLRKLSEHIATGFHLWKTTQLEDEFKRNRGSRIAKTLREFETSRVPNNFPELVRSLPGFLQLQKNTAALEADRQSCLNTIRQAASANQLEADLVIESVLKNAEEVKVTDEIIERSSRRKMRGNPPGKKDSLGDQINWECLLAALPRQSTLVMISNDGDFASELDGAEPHPFLTEEWMAKNGGQLIVYRSIPDFLANRGKAIAQNSDFVINGLIDELERSGSFAATHSVIANLMQLERFGASHVERILGACESNTQVNWIISDDDVYTFLVSLKSRFCDKNREDLTQRLKMLIAVAETKRST
jgi:hypothetical protein